MNRRQRVRNLQAFLRSNRENAQQSMIDESEEGNVIPPKQKDSEEDVSPIQTPPPAA